MTAWGTENSHLAIHTRGSVCVFVGGGRVAWSANTLTSTGGETIILARKPEPRGFVKPDDVRTIAPFRK